MFLALVESCECSSPLPDGRGSLQARRRAKALAGLTFALCIVFLPGALAAELPYPQQMAKFRAEREQEIRTDWLPLVGLYWLKEGDNAVGSNPKCEVILPPSSP